jgi:hypothetical protein
MYQYQPNVVTSFQKKKPNVVTNADTRARASVRRLDAHGP